VPGQAYVTVDSDGGIRALAAHDRRTDAELRYLRALDRYAAERCATHVVIARSPKADGGSRDLQWSRLAASAEVHVLPGDHVTLVTGHVGELAQVVRGAIDRALQRMPH
jgi:thioesterase domain-containing protein